MSTQLEKIEGKAMKSFTTSVDNDDDSEINGDSRSNSSNNEMMTNQVNELKKKIEFLNNESKHSEEEKEKLSKEIKSLREQLNQKIVNEANNKANSYNVGK